jgi:hypothetical protein
MTDLMITAPKGFIVSVIHNDDTDTDTVMVHDKTSGDMVSQCRFVGRVQKVSHHGGSIKVWIEQGKFTYFSKFEADRREKPNDYIATKLPRAFLEAK